ncbi:MULTISPECIES: DUF2958 domain-containing protein [Sphingobium]|uniref:Single-stranded DNA endonuclease n=1 Tax=Sphingobium fuliginis (strain ATCC 27551) TaxID=336203 RepID=A0ABQ1F717_SPHSA|nr:MULTISPECIES: DUF2958 domain-containing protein [Sphingobium]RYL96288.1 DUF2958 domain-containing protein [Sphingobium fuliginis]WDA36181.1 DUF2958 domain-containing protein [Sphingobium sp. YC-XJ3]GGA01381.1 single-stranded DNA endonuclease [Sphingobium fuliginis]
MIDLPHELRFALRANDVSRRACEAKGDRFDSPPVIKLFNPIGAATWLATELAEDGDALFGLADLGFGCPEMGYFSLSELSAIRLPYGLFIERDTGFKSELFLSEWANWSRRAGSILWAETLLRRAAQSG